MILIWFFILGLVVGSFVNVLVFRLHLKESIIKGRSKCPSCGHQLAVKDLIPVISFILLKGRCRYCNNLISWQYPLVELGVAILFTITGFYHFKSIFFSEINFFLLVRDLLAVSMLVAIFIYDLRFMEIPDEISLPTIIICFLLGIFGGLDWQIMLTSSFIGLSFFLMQYLISNGKWIGGGDLRLGFLMGVLLNWTSLIFAIFLSYIIGSIFALWLLIIKKVGLKTPVPFGVFLVPATIFSMFFGQQIVDWYFNLLK